MFLCVLTFLTRFDLFRNFFFLFWLFFSWFTFFSFLAITFFCSDEIFFSFQIVSRFELSFRLVEKNLVTFFSYVNLPKVAFGSYYMKWPLLTTFRTWSFFDVPDLPGHVSQCFGRFCVFWLFPARFDLFSNFFCVLTFFGFPPPQNSFLAITFFSSDEIFFSFQILSPFHLSFRLVEKSLVTFFTYVNWPKVAFWSYYMKWSFFGLSRFSTFPTCPDMSQRVLGVFACFDFFCPFRPVSTRFLTFFCVLTFFLFRIPQNSFSAITFFCSDEICFSFQILSPFHLSFRLVEKSLVTFFTYVNRPKVAFRSYYMKWPLFGLSRFSRSPTSPTCRKHDFRVFSHFALFSRFSLYASKEPANQGAGNGFRRFSTQFSTFCNKMIGWNFHM